MAKKSLNWLKPPTFDDREKTRLASLLNIALLYCIGAVLISLGGMTVFRPALALHPVPIVTVLVLVGAFILLRFGYVKGIGLGIVSSLWIHGTYSMVSMGGIQSPGSQGFFVLVVLAGLLLTWRTALVVLFVTLVTLGGVYAAQITGMLPSPSMPYSVNLYLTMQIVGLILTGGLLALGARGLQQALHRVKESETQFAELVKGSPDLILSIDSQGHIVNCNPASITMAGTNPEELLGKHFSELGLMSPDEMKLTMERFSKLKSWKQSMFTLTQNELQMPNGEIRYMETNPSVIKHPDGTVQYQFVVRDITERVRISHERDALQEQLRVSRRLEAMGRMAGGVAHDFNNLLTMIMGNSELLKMQLEGKTKERAIEIETAANRAAELTRQLLVFARCQVLAPEIIDLNQLITGIEKFLSQILDEKVELELKLGQDLEMVEADPSQLEQVIVNLVTNAKDAMPDGGKLTIYTKKHKYSSSSPRIDSTSFVSLEVKDRGIGMDSETQAHVFDPFFTTKGALGTGLGLATVQGIVSQSGGAIELESEPGLGSTFRILLPIAEDGSVAEDLPKEGGHEGYETILIVDDDTLIRNTARQSLENAGYHVLEAVDGENALDTARNHRGSIELLVADTSMPKMSGQELATCLGVEQPELKILFLSDFPKDSPKKGEATGDCVESLHKPFTSKKLCREVRRVLDK